MQGDFLFKAIVEKDSFWILTGSISLGLGAAFRQRMYKCWSPTIIYHPALSSLITPASHPMPSALHRGLSARGEVASTTCANRHDTGGKRGCDAPHDRAIVAFAGGPCACSWKLPSTPRSRTPPARGLHREQSPSCVPLKGVENGHLDPRARAARFPRPACIPGAQPLRPIALPPQIPGVTSVALHPALAKSRARLPVDFDFASMPTTGSNAAWHRVLVESATYPELPSLSIISPRLPWAITAHASGRTLRCVTVADVLGAIYEALHLHVDREQFEDWSMTQSGSHCPRRELQGGITYRYGMTRLDLLGGKTKFAGLVESTMGCDIWVVEVA
ncbi:hypothetical protein B0H17DRAFT_1094566, partial [Mycena rosella]